ncbi:MAG TPA: hypothetical protein VE890_16270, partial [Thermoguttaceae bacterium]|nr:hypothetical protein [Thermoguttaceae bacterium]
MNIGEGRLALDGTYVAMPPKADGRRLRLAFNELEQMQWYFWQPNGTDGALVRWDARPKSLRAFAIHREKIPQPLARFTPKATGLDFSRGSATTRIDRNVDFIWNDATLPAGVGRSGPILASWRGLVRFPDAGNWKFSVTTKGMVLILLNGKPILYRQASAESETSLSRSIYFGIDGDPEKKKQPAVRDIEIHYFGEPQGDGLRLQWERPLVNPDRPTYRREAIPLQTVPLAALFVDGSKDAQQGLRATYFSSTDSDAVGVIEIGQLIADDAGLWSERFDRGPIDVCYEAGAIRLLRGTIELLAIPANEPDQFLMQTQAELRGAETIRLRPSESYGELAGCSVTTSPHPLNVEQWTQDREGDEARIRIRSVDDGVEFERFDSHDAHTALIEFDAVGGCEVIARLDKATPGTGIVVKAPTEDGHEIRAMVGEHEGRRVVYTNAMDASHLRDCAMRGWFVADRFWIRCEVGLTCMRVSFSNNTETWFVVQEYRYPPEEPLATRCRMGVRTTYAEGVRILRLGELKVQRLQGLEGLANEAALAAARRRLEATDDLQASLQAIVDSPEDGISASDWAVACRVATLQLPTSRTMREESVKALLPAAAGADVSWQRLRPALVELPHRLSIGNETFARKDLAEMYQAMALRFWNSGRRDELDRLVDAWYGQHWVVWWGLIDTLPPEELTRFAMLGLAIEEDWEQLWKAALREEFYSKASRFSNRWIYDEQVRLAIWLQHLAAERYNTANPQGLQLPAAWRDQQMGTLPSQHPLAVDDRSRELESTLQQIRMAIDAQQWDLAADAVLRLPATDELVAPSTDDPLLVSSRIATGLLFEEHPALVEAMSSKQRVGKLRLARGLKYDDIRLVDSVATQFSGTEVGRAATAVLADRDL